MKAMLVIAVIAVGLTGCSHDFAEADGSKTNLNQLFIVNSSPTFLGYDFLGSDTSNHYFVAKWKYQRDSRFKVHAADLVVNKPMPFGKGTVEVLPYKPTAPGYEEFGKIVDGTNTLGGGKTLFRLCQAEEQAATPQAGSPSSTQTAVKLPKLSSSKAKFAELVFDGKAKNGMLILLDESGGDGTGYDTGYVNKNGDGDFSDKKPVKFKRWPYDETGRTYGGVLQTTAPAPADPQETVNIALSVHSSPRYGRWNQQISVDCQIADRNGRGVTLSCANIKFYPSADEARANPAHVDTKISFGMTANVKDGGNVSLSPSAQDSNGNPLSSLEDLLATIHIRDKDGKEVARKLKFEFG